MLLARLLLMLLGAVLFVAMMAVGFVRFVLALIHFFIVMVVKTPLKILSVWCMFAREGKWDFWLERAYHEIVSSFNYGKRIL